MQISFNQFVVGSLATMGFLGLVTGYALNNLENKGIIMHCFKMCTVD